MCASQIINAQGILKSLVLKLERKNFRPKKYVISANFLLYEICTFQANQQGKLIKTDKIN